MRFFHISDLHFGKLLYGYDLTEEHRNFIEQLGDYCDKYNPDAVLIAGDVYDRSVPSADAMTLLDELLNKLSGRKVFIISGNHDNEKRLSFGKDFLKKHDIYISTVPQTGENEKIEKVTFADEYGNINIYMLPFLKPALFKNSMPEEAAAGEDAIIKKLVENTDIDKNERNIILAHQFFVSGHKEPELCESEQTPAIVGGLDAVDVSAFDDFEYAALGHIHGGQFVPETLMNAVNEFEEAYEKYKNDPEFVAELDTLMREYAGRPSLLYYAEKMTKDLGGAKIYLKREDLNHTGSHKLNNCLGQCLLAKKMGKTRVIAETGAGQHGVATATVAALMGLECEIFMGKEDTIRQALNVYRMKLLGAKVNAVETGTMTLKDAVNEAMREWTNRVDDTHYVLGSVMGPHPFPMVVRDFQSVIGKEIKAQLLEKEGRLPDVVMACVGGGSNAMGAFYDFIGDESVQLIGCEAAGLGVDNPKNAATIANGTLGIFHGMKSYFCQDKYGQIAPVYSISAGLDYPGIGPEHANLSDTGRAKYVPVTDEEAVNAFEYLSRTEGIIPAIESAHAVAHCIKLAPTMSKDSIIVVNLSGRGDKDVAAIARYRGENIYE